MERLGPKEDIVETGFKDGINSVFEVDICVALGLELLLILDLDLVEMVLDNLAYFGSDIDHILVLEDIGESSSDFDGIVASLIEEAQVERLDQVPLRFSGLCTQFLWCKIRQSFWDPLSEWC